MVSMEAHRSTGSVGRKSVQLPETHVTVLFVTQIEKFMVFMKSFIKGEAFFGGFKLLPICSFPFQALLKCLGEEKKFVKIEKT